MGGVFAKIVFKSGADTLDKNKYSSVLEIPVVDLDGKEYETMEDASPKKKCYLIVNLASR